MKFDFLDTQSRPQFFSRLGVIILGTLIYAVGVNLFTVPHRFLSGGISGIALVINYHTGFRVSLLMLTINIPLFIAGFFFMDKHYLFSSLVGLFFVAFFLEITVPLNHLIPIDDSLLAAVFAGAFTGTGSGLIFKSRGSLGGTDIISSVLKKKFSIPQPTSLLVSNICIVAMAITMGRIELVLYSMVAMYTSSIIMERLLIGLQRRKTVLIASQKEKNITEMILTEMGRGATLLEGRGAYTGKPLRMVYSVIPTRQLARLKDKVYSIDPEAFINITDSSEIMGRWKQRNTRIYSRED